MITCMCATLQFVGVPYEIQVKCIKDVKKHLLKGENVFLFLVAIGDIAGTVA